MAAWAKLSVPPLQTNPSVWINIDKAKTILFLVCCRRLCRSVTKLGSYFHGISEDCSRPGIRWLKGQSRDIARIFRPWEHETNSQVGQNIRGATISSWWKIRP